MDANLLFGVVVSCLAYGFIVYLIVWSRTTIGKISKRKFGSLREILEDLRHGR